MALLFDKASDQLPLVRDDSADLDNIWAGGGTCMFWIKIDSYGTGNFGRVCGKENNNGTLGWVAHLRAEGNRIGFIHRFSGGSRQWLTTTSTILTNTLYHVAIVWDGTETDPIIYINGVSQTIILQVGNGGTKSSDEDYLFRMGDRGNNDRTYDGLIDDLRLYDLELTEDEVTDIYILRGGPGSLRGLVRRWPLGPGVSGKAPSLPYTGQTEVATANTTTITIDVPDEANDGDLLVLVGFAGGDADTALTFTEPSGWTARTYLAVDSTGVTTPSMQVFTRVASSEPADYDLEASGTSSMLAFMYSLRGVTDSVDVATTEIGTSTTPVTPTATPTENCLILRIIAFDDGSDLPNRDYDVFPGDITGLSELLIDGTDDGVGGCVAMETWDATATGAKTWGALDGSEEWGGMTVCLPFGDGREGLPLKDLSVAQGHAIAYGHLVMTTSELVITG